MPCSIGKETERICMEEEKHVKKDGKTSADPNFPEEG
jgi:hypothetical protein